MSTDNNVDEQEIAKFSRLSQEWWDPNGKLKTLHDINQTRLDYIHQHAPLEGQTVIDIGCGGGILCEAMAQKKAQVTGIDMDSTAINIADKHQQDSAYNINYEQNTAEDMAKHHPAKFDIVTCLEMLEHVPNPESIIQSCAKLVKPGGHIFLSTLNRTLKSYSLAILGAEYLLNIIPRGTHEYNKFIRPSELTAWIRHAKLQVADMKGLQYNPFTRQSHLIDELSVNYIVHITVPLKT